MTKKSEVITSIFDEIVPVEGQGIADIWGSGYPYVQWQNLLGKWECPLKYWGGSVLEFEYELEQVRHQLDVEDGFLLDCISIAPFAFKMYWEYKDASGKKIIAKERLDDIKPWRSRVHILALMKEAESMTPVVITTGSTTSKYLLANIRQGQQRIQTMLERIGYGDRPPHLFWIEMIAGKLITVGKGEDTSTICPPVAPPPVNVHKMTPKAIAKYLTSIYVGNDIRDVFSDGLWDEGQEWAAKQPERLLLDDGTNGGDNVALPPASTDAVVLVDNSLHIPDLSEAKEKDWIKCAMSIPGLFNHKTHAGRAFSKMLRDGHLQRAPKVAQWEAWKIVLVERWHDLEALSESQNREAEERVPIPQAVAEISAMDEVEACDATQDDEIPAPFQ